MSETRIDADGKIDLLVQGMVTIDGTEKIPATTYSALTRSQDGSWEEIDTHLPAVADGGRVVFLDVNGDGLPDAVESGFQDHALRTFLNTGSTFVTSALSLPPDPLGRQDDFFALAVPLDYDGDGRQDLLMPVGPGTLPGHGEALPAWAILRAQEGSPTFTLLDPHVPFEAALTDAVSLADPHGPRVADINGDGAPDVILPLSGVYHVFQNLAADQDLLTTISDGMNAHDPADPDFLPNVSITYGHLVDTSITNGTPALESHPYLSHADPNNGCAYPIACAVGSRRQVTAYTLNNGADAPRHFSVRYRDGRYHRLGHGFLGFAERIVVDEDTGAGTATFYDNVTTEPIGNAVVFPYSGQAQREWRWVPGLPTQPDPDQLVMAFRDVSRTFVPTNGGATYFTLPTGQRVRLEEGTYPGGPLGVEAYVEQIEAGNAATMLRDATSTVTDFDDFGNVLAEDTKVAGVDLTLHVERVFKNDTDRWVLGQLQAQTDGVQRRRGALAMPHVDSPYDPLR